MNLNCYRLHVTCAAAGCADSYTEFSVVGDASIHLSGYYMKEEGASKPLYARLPHSTVRTASYIAAPLQGLRLALRCTHGAHSASVRMLDQQPPCALDSRPSREPRGRMLRGTR
jgi:hypothetical protein